MGGPWHYLWATETYSLELEGTQRYAVVFALSPGAPGQPGSHPRSQTKPSLAPLCSSRAGAIKALQFPSWLLVPSMLWQRHASSECPAFHWWVLGIVCQPGVPFCACLQNKPEGLTRVFIAVQHLPCLSECSSSCSLHRPAALLWLQWGIAGAVTLSSIVSTWCYSARVIHTLPSVSLGFSTAHGSVCSVGWSVLGQSFQNVPNESLDPLERYCTWIDHLAIRSLAGLTVLCNVKK